MRSLQENTQAAIDLSVVLMIVIAFAALMVVAYIIWKIKDQLIETYPGHGTDAAGNTSALAWNTTYWNSSQSVGNITGGFDDAVSLILVAITIFILAIAIGALLMLRGR